MKKMVLGAAMPMTAGTAFAANDLQQGAMAISVDAFYSPGLVEDISSGGTQTGFGMVKGKYMISRDMQINAGLGYATWGKDASGNDFTLSAGIRKFLRTDDLAPFIGGRISHTDSTSGTVDVNATELAVEFGAEYFVGKQFSVEGSASIGYASASVGNADITRFGTSRAGVGFNFYF